MNVILVDVKLLDLETEMSSERFNEILDGADRWIYSVTPGNSSILHLVANSGEASRFRSLLRNPIYVSGTLLCQNKRGETALHCAARKGNISFLDIFISNMSNINEKKRLLLEMKNKQGDTALHLATRNNHFEVVKRLINEDRCFECMPNNSGECPLYVAAFKGFREITEILVKTSATGPGRMNALHAASFQGHLDVVELLLDKRPELCTERDEKGRTPLFCVASMEKVTYKGGQQRINNILQALINKNISNVLLLDTNGLSALHVAAVSERIDVLQEILGRRRDFCELVDNTGKTFLHVAVEFKREKVVRYVLKDLVRVEELLNQPDDEGNTPLHLAVHGSELGIVRMLLEDKRVVLDSVNQKGQTPFDVAYSVFWENPPHRQLRTGVILDYLRYFGMKSNPEKSDLVEVKRRMDILAEEYDKYRRSVSNTIAIVVVLITTITFAAAVFTLRGAYKKDTGPEQGMDFVTRLTSFMMFLISDTLAMIIVIIVIWFLYRMESQYHDTNLRAFYTSVNLLQYSFVEMVTSFAAGVYAVILGRFVCGRP